MYSTNRFRNATKCSAFLIFPGTASFSMSSDSTVRLMRSASGFHRVDDTLTRIRQHIVLFSTLIRLLQTGHQLCILILQFTRISPLDSTGPIEDQCHFETQESRAGTHSSIFSPSLITLLAAESSIGRVRSTDSDSMQTLSMLCASSKTTILSLLISFDT